MNVILVDESGYNQFIEELERLKEQSLHNSTIGSNVYQDAIGDGWHDNFAFEDSMRESRKIATKIEDMLKTKEKLKIIKRKELPHN